MSSTRINIRLSSPRSKYYMWFQTCNSKNSWIIKKSISKEINKTRNKARKKGGNKTRKKIFDKNLKLDNVNDNLPLSKEKVSQIIQII